MNRNLFSFYICVCVKWEEGVEIPTDINLTVRSTVSEMSEKKCSYYFIDIPTMEREILLLLIYQCSYSVIAV